MKGLGSVHASFNSIYLHATTKLLKRESFNQTEYNSNHNKSWASTNLWIDQREVGIREQWATWAPPQDGPHITYMRDTSNLAIVLYESMCKKIHHQLSTLNNEIMKCRTKKRKSKGFTKWGTTIIMHK